MAETTNISWSDKTWSPWYGCTQVSMGDHGACEGCYARFLSETRQHRVVFGGPGRGEGTRDAKAESGWKEPLKWEREAKEAYIAWTEHGHVPPEPQTFVFPSLCDPFDNHPDLAPLRRRFFDLIRKTPNLTWLLLTKRPGNIVRLFAETRGEDDDELSHRFHWPRNAAIGCTVVTQEEADRDIPKLLAAKAALNPAFAFVSMEPLLGPVDIRDYLMPVAQGSRLSSEGKFGTPTHSVPASVREPLDWVITGGETDQGAHKARPSHPDWFRSLRDQCAAAGVAFHHKQTGEWAPICWLDDGVSDSLYHPAPRRDPDAVRRCKVEHTVMNGDGSLHPSPADPETYHPHHHSMLMFKAGKHIAGRLLDGVVHDARPAVRA